MRPNASMLATITEGERGEIGQVAAVAVVFMLLQTIKQQPWEIYLRRWASVGVAAMGIFWFAQRAFI